MGQVSEKQVIFWVVLLSWAVAVLQAQTNSPDDYTIIKSINVDEVVADFPARFSFLESNGKHYAGYYNEDRQLTVAVIDPQTGQTDIKALDERVGWDAHNSIVMAVDSTDGLHVSGNMHNVPLIYYRTLKAGDVQTLTKQFPMVSSDKELRCTYPHFMKNKDQDLIFTYRMGGSGNGINIYNIYDVQTRRWSPLLDSPLFDGCGRMSAYITGPRLASDGYYHVVWVWRVTPDCKTNCNLSYIKSPNLKDWYTVDGTAVSLPVVPDFKEAVVDPVSVGGGLINGGNTFTVDDAGRPCIAYHKYDQSGHNQLFVALWQNTQWTIQQVSNWDYRWNFSGPGSIQPEIRVNSFQPMGNDRMSVGYWHTKYGVGSFVIEADTGRLIKEQSAPSKRRSSPWPADLIKPTSKLENMSVRWSRMIRDRQNPTIAYVLRWESLPKNRFYEAPEKSVPAATLKWLKVGTK